MSEIKLIHEPLIRWLRESGIAFIRSRSDRATSTACGDPDFVLLHARLPALCIEAKLEKGRLSAAQVKRHAELAACGIIVHVVRSYETAVALIQAWLSNAAPAAVPLKTGAEIARFAQAVWTRPDKTAAWQRVRAATADDIHIPFLK